ncbi:MAG TPA: oligosaccharide flippase family protein [Silvibacterium sp.]|nr:oligosaccharide flippase family protein [Silvibacterium sp.]
MTTRRENLLLLKNAGFNVIRGGASAAVAVFLPPFLTRSMSTQAFGAWSLVLQLSAYVGYLDFGIQTAVARFVAHCTERGDAEHRDRIVSTALACLIACGCIAISGLLLLASFLPQIFHHLQHPMIFDIRVALLLVGGSLSIGIPASVFTGTFVGFQRNELPAVIIGGSRIISALLLVVVVRHGGGIVSMAIVLSIANLSSYAIQYLVFRKVIASLIPTMHLSPRHVSVAAARELFDYCFSLTVWGVGLLLVTGLDLTIVGIYRFDQVAYYAVAATAVTFLAGMFGAIFGAMGAPAAVVHARGDRAELGRLVVVSTRLGMVLLLGTGLPLILFAGRLLRFWVGPEYAQHAALLLEVLVTANILRVSATPYALAMIGSGEQRRVILIPLLEGVTNLISSVILGRYFGALGVALGTLVGAIFGFGGNLFYNMRRTPEIQFSVREYVQDSLLRPSLCFAPLVLSVLLRNILPSMSLRSVSAVVGCLLSILLFWQVVLIPEERRKIGSAARNRLARVQLLP